MTYNPEWDGPSEEGYLTELEGSSGLARRRIVSKDGKPARVKWLRRGPERIFQECDFAVPVQDSLVSNCTFRLCRFAGSSWKNVKFSNCKFELCDFSESVFAGCYFIGDCAFHQNSTSAELFRMEETAISASAFITSLQTNLGHVPDGRKEFQKSRFFSTRKKVAKTVFSATRNEADLDYYFEAYEQLARCTLAHEVERLRFDERTGIANPRVQFWIRSFPPRIERAITEISGWLSNWGRSLVRSGVFLVSTVSFFTLLYWLLEVDPSLSKSRGVASSLIEATDVTLVAGYTAHFKSSAPLHLQFLWVLNMILGLFWYSLIIPVVTRRILR